MIVLMLQNYLKGHYLIFQAHLELNSLGALMYQP